MSGRIDQFGHGIITPFQRDGKGDFANADGVTCLVSDVSELLGIQGPGVRQPGELPWDMDLGSRLQHLRHRKMHVDMVAATAQQLATEPLRRYEKRVRPGIAVVEPSPTGYPTETLKISFSFQVVGQDSAQNLMLTVKE